MKSPFHYVLVLLLLLPLISSVKPRAATLGQGGDSLYVASTGADTNPGTKQAPLKTIQAAINKATPPQNVLVAAGVYPGAIMLRAGVSIIGGHSEQNWQQKSDLVTELTSSTVVAGRIVVVSGSSITTPTSLEQLKITAGSTNTPGISVYGIHAAGCTALVIKNCTVTAGNGGPGTSGSNGAAGAAGLRGANGGVGSCDGSVPGAATASSRALRSRSPTISKSGSPPAPRTDSTSSRRRCPPR